MKALVALVVVMLLGGQARADEETVEVIDPGAGRKKVALALAVGGASLWVGSAVVSLVTRRNYDRCAEDGALRDDLRDCPYQDVVGATRYANHQQEISRILGTSMWIAGFGLLASALYLRLTVPEKRRIVRISLTPEVSPSAVGLTFTGGF